MEQLQSVAKLVFGNNALLHNIAHHCASEDCLSGRSVNKQWKKAFTPYVRISTYYGWSVDPLEDDARFKSRVDLEYKDDETMVYEWAGVRVTNLMTPFFCNKFRNIMTPMENQCKEIRDASLIGRGQGLLRDTIDPAFNIDSDFWVATRFTFKNKKATVSTIIPGVPQSNSIFYLAVAEVVEQMAPHLEQFFNFDPEDGYVDAIINSQVYELESQEEYLGQYHTDGLPEEAISTTAIWYYDIDTDLQGGELTIGRILRTPRYRRSFETVDVPMKSNDMILFRNSDNVHRVAPLKNCGDSKAKRKIISFFFVDPSHNSVTSEQATVNSEITDLEAVRKRRDEFKEARKPVEDKNARGLMVPRRGRIN